MPRQGPIVNRAKAFIATWASTFGDQLNVLTLKQHMASYLDKKFIKWYGLIVKEEPDEKINRVHFHGLFWLPPNEKKRFNITSKALDLDLPNQVISVQVGTPDQGEAAYDYININEFTALSGNKYGEVTWTKGNIEWAIIQKYGKQLPWKILTKAHPNLEGWKYGELEDIFLYCLKQNHEKWASDTIDQLKLAIQQEKEFQKQSPNSKKPNWGAMRANGMGFDEAVEFLKENFPNEFMDHWHKWEPAALKFFDVKEEVEEIDWEAEYWIPIKIINWFDNNVRIFTDHMNDKEWQRKNRNRRPMSLIWIGKSKRGKTTIAKAFMGNYYQHLMDGFHSFKSNAPVTVIDDFHWDFNKYFTNWRCWLGAQNKFTVNPKYGRRKKLDWGHPVVVLHNKEIVTYEGRNCSFDEEDMEYINENCIIINTGSQYLWEKPNVNPVELLKWRKVKLEYFKPSWMKTEEPKTSPVATSTPIDTHLIESDDELPPVEEIWDEIMKEIDNGRWEQLPNKKTELHKENEKRLRDNDERDSRSPKRNRTTKQ